MNISDEVRRILEMTGYRVKDSLEYSSFLYFEDESLFGFVSIHETVEDLIAKWKIEQDTFLHQNARFLRTSPAKSWNAYSIFLTHGKSTEETKVELFSIEEDFQGMRKIARADLFSRADIVRALFPILPIQNIVNLTSEEPLNRIRARLELPEKQVSMLLENRSADEIANSLIEEFEG